MVLIFQPYREADFWHKKHVRLCSDVFFSYIYIQ